MAGAPLQVRSISNLCMGKSRPVAPFPAASSPGKCLAVVSQQFHLLSWQPRLHRQDVGPLQHRCCHHLGHCGTSLHSYCPLMAPMVRPRTSQRRMATPQIAMGVRMMVPVAMSCPQITPCCVINCEAATGMVCVLCPVNVVAKA